MIYKVLILAAGVAILSLGTLSARAFAYDPLQGPCTGKGASSSVCQGRGNSSQNPLLGPNGLLFGISKIIAGVAGLAAVVIVVMSGFRLIVAGGDAGQIKSARDALIAALVGIVIIVFAESIISLVLSRV